MAAIIKDNYRIYNAQQFMLSLSETPVEYLYVFIGRNQPWEDEAAPDTPRDNYESEFIAYRDMFTMKRVQPSDASLEIVKRDWISGTVYDEYFHDYSAATITVGGVSSLFDADFYVVTDELNVYKVLNNANNSPSTVKPTGTLTTDFTTADGYVWKYMYTVSAGDALKFVSPDFIPVKTLTSDNGSAQWAVQQAAIDGAIHHIKVVEGGSGYTTASVSISGDGVGATATPVISNGSIDRIVITNKGTGYRFAEVTITGDGQDAVVKAAISPKGGHGSDAVYELGGFYLGVSASFEYDENGDAPTANDYRKIGMIINPKNYGTLTPAVADSLRVMRGMVMSVSGSGVFVEDEIITGSVSGASASVVFYDQLSRILYYTQTPETGFLNFSLTETIQGVSSGATHTYDSEVPPEVEYDTGTQLFLEQRRQISRDINQAETILIVSVF